MNPEPKKKTDCEDEVTEARRILDEIIEETESEDWDEEQPQTSPVAQSTSTHPTNVII